MEPHGSGQRRAFRLSTVILSLLALLVLVAYSSRSGFGHTSKARPTPGYVNWAVSVFLMIFVLMIPFAVYAYWLQMREWRAQSQTRSFQSRVLRSFGILVLVLGIGFAITLLHKHGLSIDSLRKFLKPQNPTGKVTPGELHTSPYNPKFRWPVLWGTIVLLAAGFAYVLWRRKHSPQPEPGQADETVAEAVAASIDGALDDLENEADARRAVIAAYARMEAVLARMGLRRKQSETSLEYLRRILLGLTSRTDAVTRLTGLFEQAKFSRHEIDGTMKQEAIDALRAIRDDLQPAEA